MMRAGPPHGRRWDRSHRRHTTARPDGPLPVGRPAPDVPPRSDPAVRSRPDDAGRAIAQDRCHIGFSGRNDMASTFVRRLAVLGTVAVVTLLPAVVAPSAAHATP